MQESPKPSSHFSDFPSNSWNVCYQTYANFIQTLHPPVKKNIRIYCKHQSFTVQDIFNGANRPFWAETIGTLCM